MSKNKAKADTISEREYTVQMASHSSLPETDSPDDTESDAGAEFLMGLNFMPDEDTDFESHGDEPGEIDFSDAKPKVAKSKSDRVTKIPDTAKVVWSELPGPWEDLDTPSDTN